MRAAANPADSDVLYYVARICGEGAHEFSSSDAEFQRDVARYNAERERRGGRAPTNC
jgi:cell division protein YceG involved in septum cleavage